MANALSCKFELWYSRLGGSRINRIDTRILRERLRRRSLFQRALSSSASGRLVFVGHRMTRVKAEGTGSKSLKEIAEAMAVALAKPRRLSRDCVLCSLPEGRSVRDGRSLRPLVEE